MSFPGFPKDALTFLEALRANNSAVWFKANRADYERFLVEPAKAFVEAAGAILGPLVPGIEAQPRVMGSIFRMNRDIRFSKDKRPYKENLDLWFWEGDRKAAASGFFVRINPDELLLGAGWHGFVGSQLARFRAALDVELEQLAAELARQGRQLHGEHYKRLPAGVDANSAGAAFGRHRALYLEATFDPETVLDGARLAEVCRREWTAAAPLHRWLVSKVQEQVTP